MYQATASVAPTGIRTVAAPGSLSRAATVWTLRPGMAIACMGNLVEGIVTGWQKNMTPKVADEVGYIINQFDAENIKIGVEPADSGVDYMYADGQILVRDEHLKRVRQILQQPVLPDRVKRVIAGVVILFLGETETRDEQPTVPGAIDEIDAQLGKGIATPNHLLTAAGEVSPCTPVEVMEVEHGIEPFPAVCGETDGRGVLIYIADTGLLADASSTHAWLNGVEGALDPLQPQDTNGIQPTISPYAGHGTFVAGVVRCMAPAADVYVSAVFKVAGSAFESDLIQDLDQALGLGVDVFNLSITGPTKSELPLLTFEVWRNRLRRNKGVVCVAAAGNDGSRLPSWPAAAHETVSVGALAADWRSRAKFSNHGGWVDVYAPGRDLVNAYATGTYTCYAYPHKNEARRFFGMAKWSGTSFSAAIVTGLIAHRMSRTGENGKQAAAALLAQARAQAIPGTGAILLPCGNNGKPAQPACCAHHHDAAEQARARSS